MRNRAQFFWSQQRYILENIKLADTKAGFVITLGCAGISAFFSRAVHLPPTPRSIVILLFVLGTLGVSGLLAAIGYGAWAIKPRLGLRPILAPVSWTEIARYPTLEAFQGASRILTEDEATEALGEQVFHLSRICSRKHRLIARSILLAMGGGLCLILDLLVIHLITP